MAPRKLIGLTGNIATGKSNVLSEMRALGAVIIDVIFWAFAFLRMGTMGLTAQALGRADDAERRAVIARALLLGVLCGVLGCGYELKPNEAPLTCLRRMERERRF